MAMIRCIECERKISDNSQVCANCGMPTKDSIRQHKNNTLRNAAIRQEKLDLPMGQIVRIKAISFFWLFCTFLLLNFLNVMVVALVFYGKFQFPWTTPAVAVVVGTAALTALLNCGYKLQYVDSDGYFRRLAGLIGLVYLATFIFPIPVAMRFSESSVGSLVGGLMLFFCGGLVQLMLLGNTLDGDFEQT